MNIEAKKLTPDLLDDYLNFFDNTPHATNKYVEAYPNKQLTDLPEKEFHLNVILRGSVFVIIYSALNEARKMLERFFTNVFQSFLSMVKQR